MRYSICSWTFGNTPIEKVFNIVSAKGYKHIDLQAKVDDYNWQEINHLARENSLNINGLLCDSGWPEEEKDLANKNIVNRQKAVDYFKRQVECVKVVEGNYLVVVPSAVGKFHTMGGNKSEDLKWAIESVAKLTDMAKEHDITLVIEPINRYESCIVNNSDDVLHVVKEVNHPNVKALLDTYHMNIEEVDMEEAFLKLKDWVEVVHFADSNRRGVGRGHINFQKIVHAMKKIGFDKNVVFECLAPGPHPFNAEKGEETERIMSMYAEESLDKLKTWFS
ncbi:Sugar phosphate isomerase/epimerase [Alteribacillus persepolensis]|uniref:Sugar phosphate isomerase/epimerase n=1 Tax=Alteribacillus persepolensis TaxID=568899 RepID=A0A1G8JU24_9BACI|nr:sugar phosphate isomerase/epimerase [Alteribacillus persepolensis]SDI34635.1 Sugar phosphate isomerase/epimerase [Alteribacillus persepolensis]